jgi:hypothetical protein
VKQAVRLYDVPTRYGGDEFAVILPDSDTEAAARVAQRVLEKAGTAALPAELREAAVPLGLSIGIATFPRPAGDANALVEGGQRDVSREDGGRRDRVWNTPSRMVRAARCDLRVWRCARAVFSDPARLATRELQTLIRPRSRRDCRGRVTRARSSPSR